MTKLKIYFFAIFIISPYSAWAIASPTKDPSEPGTITKFQQLSNSFAAAKDGNLNSIVAKAYAGSCFLPENNDSKFSIIGTPVANDVISVQNAGIGAVLVGGLTTQGLRAVLIDGITREVSLNPQGYTDFEDVGGILRSITIEAAQGLSSQISSSIIAKDAHQIGWVQSLIAQPEILFLVETRVANIFPAGTGRFNGASIVVKETVKKDGVDFTKYCEFHELLSPAPHHERKHSHQDYRYVSKGCSRFPFNPKYHCSE